MLPYGRQLIEDDDIEAVANALRGDFLTTGPKIEEFEKELCAVTGAKFSVVCSSGTAALHLAALTLDLGENDAVVVPTITFLATANAVRYCGAQVVFADVNPETGLMEPGHFEEALARCGTLKPRAVFPVHLAGQCVDLPAIEKMARGRDMAVVTDVCHALGSVSHGKKAGSCTHEDVAVFSFHPVKTICMGEGGAITTNDAATAERLRRLRSHGMVRRPDLGPWYYEMPEPGYNYRATDFQCALGVSQIKKLDRFVARRRSLARRYDALLQDLAPYIQAPWRVPDGDPAWHLYAVRADFDALGVDRTTLMEDLKQRGIGTQVHYIPVHRQPYYRQLYGTLDLPGADSYYDHTLSLPLYPGMKDEDVDFVIKTLKNVIAEKNHADSRIKNSYVR